MTLLHRGLSDVKRFIQITFILYRAWFVYLLGKIPVVRLLFPGAPPTAPQRARETFERLGPTFIKFGQILAQRPDVVPQRYIDELEKLEDSVPPFDPEEAREIVVEELGPIQHVFDEFEEEPLAAASIAQVHRATLRNGDEVVVKVRRPGIKEQMEQDLDILKFLAKFGEHHIGFLENMRTYKAVREFARWTHDELDLKKEGRNGRILAENLEDEDRIKVPHIYMEHTTEKVLVMEYVEGVKSNDAEALQNMDIDEAEIAATAVRAGLKQVIRDGFFHADPHPSNFLISPDGDLIYLDFGMVGKFSKTMRRNLGLLVLHSLNEDVDAAIETIKRIGTVDDNADMDALREDLEDIMTLLKHSTIEEQSITMSLLNMARRANRHGVHLPPQITIMGKAMLTMEGIGLTIYPEFELGKEYKRVVEKLLWQLNSPKDLAETLLIDMAQNRDLLAKLPTKINNVMEGLTEPKVETTVKIERTGTKRAAIAAALIISSALLLLESLPTEQAIYVAVAEMILAALIFL